MGKHVEELVVKECKASEFADCDIVFSGLDADVAGDIGVFAFSSTLPLSPSTSLPSFLLDRTQVYLFGFWHWNWVWNEIKTVLTTPIKQKWNSSKPN